MRKKGRVKRQPKNLKMAGWFTLAIATLIILSGILKLIILINESKFDGNHFTLEITNQNKFISFSPKDQSVAILKVQSGIDVAKSWEIPVDEKINSDQNISKDTLAKELFLLGFKGKINFLDSIKLSFYSSQVKSDSIEEIITPFIPSKPNINSFFADPNILEEKQSIEIINSTDESGLGNRLANYLTNLGCNVVLVTTGDPADKSQISYSDSSYTVAKISKLLGYKSIKMSKKDIADIIIIIGRDNKKPTNF